MEERTSNYEMNNPEEKMKRTKKIIMDSLLELLKKQDFTKIMVNDICANANISRATFYMYFEDKYNLLKYTYCHLNKMICDSSPERNLKNDTIETLNLIYKYKEAFRHLVFGETNIELITLSGTCLHRVFLYELERLKSEGVEFTEDIMIISIFLTGGLGTLLSWWMEYKYTVSIEEMTRYIMDYYECIIKSYVVKKRSE